MIVLDIINLRGSVSRVVLIRWIPPLSLGASLFNIILGLLILEDSTVAVDQCAVHGGGPGESIDLW